MVSGDVDEIWEDRSSAGTILSPKSNVLAAWRLEPSLLLNQSCPSKDLVADAWIAQASQRDMESLTLALQKELCSRNERKLTNSAWKWQGSDSTAWSVKTECSSDVGSPMTSSEIDNTGAGSPIKLQAFGGAAASKQYVNARGSAGANAGKVSKRRSRASNKSPITFLAADPSNFRAMVQQVTGFPLSPNAGHAGGGLLRPQPTRKPPPSNNNNITIQGLPTLDTSALLIHSLPPQQCRADVSVTNFLHLQPQQRPLPSPNHSLAPASLSQLPSANSPLDPLAKSKSSSNLSMRGEFLTQKLKSARVKPNRSILDSVDQTQTIDFPEFKPPKSSISADSFLLVENDHPDHARCNMIPNVMHDNNIPLDSWFSPDGLINSS